MSVIKSIYSRILSHFPGEMEMVFAYGSGAFQQTSLIDKSNNMLDFIISVNNSTLWHQENIKRNKDHYSFLKKLGPKTVAKIQDKYGANIYFNTMVPCEGRMIKYGVISTDRLVNDLLDWDTLYVSGRLHKPVHMLVKPSCNVLQTAMNINRQSAVHAALLLLPDVFSEEDLFMKIAGLSYSGDLRMSMAEDQNKVSNIVKPNVRFFRELYTNELEQQSDHLYWDKHKGTFEQQLCSATQHYHLNMLPKAVQIGLVAYRNMDGRTRDTEEVLKSISQDTRCDELITMCISGIVKNSSLTQTAKGLFTAGIVKSVKYGWKKVKKWWKSR